MLIHVLSYLLSPTNHAATSAVSLSFSLNSLQHSLCYLLFQHISMVIQLTHILLLSRSVGESHEYSDDGINTGCSV